MKGDMGALIASYELVRKQMSDLLAVEPEPEFKALHDLDAELKRSFDKILTAIPSSSEESLHRVKFLIELINEASEGNSLVVEMTQSIASDFDNIVQDGGYGSSK